MPNPLAHLFAIKRWHIYHAASCYSMPSQAATRCVQAATQRAPGVCYSFGSLAANLCLCNAICPEGSKASAIGLVVTAFSVASYPHISPHFPTPPNTSSSPPSPCWASRLQRCAVNECAVLAVLVPTSQAATPFPRLSTSGDVSLCMQAGVAWPPLCAHLAEQHGWRVACATPSAPTLTLVTAALLTSAAPTTTGCTFYGCTGTQTDNGCTHQVRPLPCLAAVRRLASRRAAAAPGPACRAPCRAACGYVGGYWEIY